MGSNIHIYFTNDFHSNFKNWPRVVHYLNTVRWKNNCIGDPYLLVDIGDHMDRVHPITEATMGKANVKLLDDAGYDVVTLGNNEGITLAHDDLYHLYDEADFQVVCANILHREGDSPGWLQSTVQYKLIDDVRVGIIGLTAPFNDYYELLGWHAQNPYDVLDEQIEIMRQRSDIVILLSHLGLSEDQEIARRYPDIDVIIGGHTHHLLRTGEWIGDTIITAAGKSCTFVGEVTLEWDNEKKRVIAKSAHTTDVTQMEEDEKTLVTLEQLSKQAKEILEHPIVELEKGIDIHWFQQTTIMQELTEMMCKWTNADMAMLNAGVLLEGFSAGPVTYYDVHKNCPHPINPCVVELSGKEILEVIRVSFTKDFMEMALKGFGFRGKVIGRMIFAGIQVETQRNEKGEEKPLFVGINGLPLNESHHYSVAIADTFTFGRLLPEVAKSAVKRYFVPEFLRDLLAKTLKMYH